MATGALVAEKPTKVPRVLLTPDLTVEAYGIACEVLAGHSPMANSPQLAQYVQRPVGFENYVLRNALELSVQTLLKHAPNNLNFLLLNQIVFRSKSMLPRGLEKFKRWMRGVVNGVYGNVSLLEGLDVSFVPINYRARSTLQLAGHTIETPSTPILQIGSLTISEEVLALLMALWMYQPNTASASSQGSARKGRTAWVATLIWLARASMAGLLAVFHVKPGCKDLVMAIGIDRALRAPKAFSDPNDDELNEINTIISATSLGTAEDIDED
ncbi:hypothetical protein HDU93_006009 [Gonapodya sp. JEL0774]|nr:hypothetical protein HDU93_006009 [Gonapodya sp. JEL0774]